MKQARLWKAEAMYQTKKTKCDLCRALRAVDAAEPKQNNDRPVEEFKVETTKRSHRGDHEPNAADQRNQADEVVLGRRAAGQKSQERRRENNETTINTQRFDRQSLPLSQSSR